MATPLVASYRIKLQYVVGGLTHVNHAYCVPQATGAQPWKLIKRGAVVSTLTWQAIAGNWWHNVWIDLMASSVPGALATLEQKVGLLWVPLDFLNIVDPGVGGPTFTPAQQATLVLRDTSFDKIRVVFLETVDGYLGHSANGHGLTTQFDLIIPEYEGSGTSESSPVNWQVGRSNNYMLTAGAVAGLTLDQNRKLKRARHDE
jgi:hypothetical protein